MSEKSKKDRVAQLAALYPRLIEWSDEDKAYLGSAPPLIGPSCHGDTVAEVATQLEAIVMDLCEDIVDGSMPQPEPPQKSYSGNFNVRIDPMLHRFAALRALSRKQSLNDFVAEAITAAAYPQHSVRQAWVRWAETLASSAFVGSSLEECTKRMSTILRSDEPENPYKKERAVAHVIIDTWGRADTTSPASGRKSTKLK